MYVKVQPRGVLIVLGAVYSCHIKWHLTIDIVVVQNTSEEAIEWLLPAMNHWTKYAHPSC